MGPARRGVSADRGGLLALAGILGFYLVAGCLMAIWTPAVPDGRLLARFTPPDEGAHVAYLRELSQWRGLPHFGSGVDNYEAHQPPLYYISALPAYWLARAIAPGGAEALSRGGYVIVRLWSVLLGAGGLILAYILGRLVFPMSRGLQLAVPAALAALPSRTFICATVSNDVASELFSAGALVLMVGGLRSASAAEASGFSLRRTAWLALTLSLGLLSKTTCLALLPAAALALTVASLRGPRRDFRGLLLRLAILALIISALWGWWAARNVVLYGDPLAASAFREIFSKDRATPEYFYEHPDLRFTPAFYARFVAICTILSLWGVYGQASAYMPMAYYLLGRFLVAGMAVGLLLWLLRGPGAALERGQAATWAVLAAVIGVVIANFAAFNADFFQAQARYLFCANPALAIAFVSALSWLLIGRRRLYAVWAGVGLLVIMTLWSLATMQNLSFADKPPL